MLKKFKKLGLALLLPATAMVIATPLVLTSCNASESLVIESEKQNNENLVVDSTTSDQTQTKEKIVTNLSSANHSKEELIDDYLFPELIRQFADFSITPGTVPASNKFRQELEEQSGYLNAAIKLYNFNEKITNIKIKNKDSTSEGGDTTTPTPSDFTISNGAAGEPDELSIPITITFEQEQIVPLSQKTTTSQHNYDLKIKPYITTFNDVEFVNIALDILNRYVNSQSTMHHNKIAVKTLYDEFSTNVEGKESVLEQAITKGFDIADDKTQANSLRESGLVSYFITLTDQETVLQNKKPLLDGFIPFKIKGNYSYYLDNYGVKKQEGSSNYRDLTNNN